MYVNDKKTDKVRLKPPEDEAEYYFYDFDVYLKLPDNADYLIKFVVSSSKYIVTATTDATKTNSEYAITTTGGGKTKIMTGICIKADELIKKFDVEVEITITKIW